MAKVIARAGVPAIGMAMFIATLATAAPAKDPASRAAPPATSALQEAASQSAADQEEVKRLKAMRGDHDQGDDNASPRAKEVVCSKNTPAAQRSAICDTASPN
jgi:hypothetical protein